MEKIFEEVICLENFDNNKVNIFILREIMIIMKKIFKMKIIN